MLSSDLKENPNFVEHKLSVGMFGCMSFQNNFNQSEHIKEHSHLI